MRSALPIDVHRQWAGSFYHTRKQGKRFTFCTLLVGSSVPQAPVMQSWLCGCKAYLWEIESSEYPSNKILRDSVTER